MNLTFKHSESFMVTDIVGMWTLLSLYYLCKLQKGMFFQTCSNLNEPNKFGLDQEWSRTVVLENFFRTLRVEVWSWKLHVLRVRPWERGTVTFSSREYEGHASFYEHPWSDSSKNQKVLFPQTNDNDDRGGWLWISMSSALRLRVLENLYSKQSLIVKHFYNNMNSI